MRTRTLVPVLIGLILSLSFINQVSAQGGCFDVNGRPTACPTESPRDDTGRSDDIPPDSDGDGTADPLDACPERPGDGNNGGCPDGVDPNNPEEVPATSPEFELQVAPPSSECQVSPSGDQGVNMREFPVSDSDIIHVLQPNEWATVHIVVLEGEIKTRSEHQFGGLIYIPQIDSVLPPVDPDPTPTPDPDPDPTPDPELDVQAVPHYWLWIETGDGIFGWVSETVVRTNNNCADWDSMQDTPGMLDVMFMPTDGGGIEIPAENGFLSFPNNPGPDPMPPLVFDVRLPEEGSDDSFDFAPECVLVDLGNGASILECADGSTPMFTYCVTELGAEAGMYEENCYEVEVPEGCVVTTSEAGVYHMECDGDGGVGVTPFGDDTPSIFIQQQGTALVGLLLPAVQQAREAAR